VERGLREVVRCSMEIAGESPSMESTSGFSICSRNWRAYADSDSTYRRCPSAKIVSKASDDLPDPETPVMTTNLLRGTTTSMFLGLCSRAPRMTMDSMCGCGRVVSRLRGLGVLNRSCIDQFNDRETAQPL